jgi:hypothetical protein
MGQVLCWHRVPGENRGGQGSALWAALAQRPAAGQDALEG